VETVGSQDKQYDSLLQTFPDILRPSTASPVEGCLGFECCHCKRLLLAGLPAKVCNIQNTKQDIFFLIVNLYYTDLKSRKAKIWYNKE
jgi:hypothetical protein